MEALGILTQRQAEHAKAVVLLNDDWKRIGIALDEARMTLENVKKSYFAHVHEHGC